MEVKVADRSALAPGKPLSVEVEGRTIALFDVDGTLRAIDDTCTHAGASLAEGEVEDGTVVCPWHGARFDLTTGEVRCPPAGRPVRAYPVALRGQEIWVELD